MTIETIEFIKTFLEILFKMPVGFGILYILSPILGIFFLIKSVKSRRWQEILIALGGLLIINFILFTLIILQTVLTTLN